MVHSFTRLKTGMVKPHPRNARTHSKKQTGQIAASMQEFGFTAPLIVDEEYVLIAGHGRLEAAKSLGIAEVPVIVVKGLSAERKRALMLADNRIAQSAGWDRELLSIEIPELQAALAAEGLDLAITGFEPAEIDALMADFEESSRDPADDIDAGCDGPGVTRTDDLWKMGQHRLLCGDARIQAAYVRLMGNERAHMGFTDSPYNLAIKGVVGRGAVKHREFQMASGEMSRAEFISFLCETLGLAAKFSAPGAVHFAFMDWRHYAELVEAGRRIYGPMLNTIVWVKSNAGQGSFYRSQHELIGVFKVGDAPHLNTVELGRHGRNRTNVWQYAGVNSFRAGRLEDLRSHPTVKPVALVADGIKDCTRRGQIVLDCFCGSGTTLLAAERVGRHGRGLEIDPGYVDLAVRRWQAFAGRDAVHETTGLTFEEMGTRRASGAEEGAAAPPARRQRSAAGRAGR